MLLSSPSAFGKASVVRSSLKLSLAAARANKSDAAEDQCTEDVVGVGGAECIFFEGFDGHDPRSGREDIVRRHSRCPLLSARRMRITHLPTVVKSVTITFISIAVAMEVALPCICKADQHKIMGGHLSNMASLALSL